MSTRQRKLHQYLWYFLLLLLFIVLSVGLFIVIFQEDRFPFLFVVGAFSIAYALHVFSVSGTLCGIYVRECNDNKAQGLDELEYPIVTSAMCALAGGLIILLSGGLLATELPPFLAVWTYAVGALVLLGSVIRYVFSQRNWPRQAREILFPASPAPSAEPSAEGGPPRPHT